MKKLMKLGLVFGLLACVVTGCGSSEETDATVLRVATAAPYAPYESMNEAGELEGFDIDLGNAIAEELGYTIEWVNLDFDAALLEVQGGTVDMMIAGLSPSDERKEVMDFSTVYYSDDTANMVVTLSSNGYTSVDDLVGLIAGCQDGTIQQTTVESILDDYSMTLETRKQYADIVLEIINGNIDFMVCEEANAIEFCNTYPELTSFVLGAGENPEGNAVAFPFESELLDEFNTVIAQFQEDGTIDALAEKWFTDEE